jgi:hypothetical protein
MHTTQIIWFLMWPVSIYITYRVILFILNRYEKKMAAKNHGKVVTGS